MQAAIFKETGTPLVVERVADPTPGAGDVIVAVERAGICGSDLHVTRHGMVPPGTVLGHEFAGKIVALGEGVSSHWRIGDRVTALPIHACHECDACNMQLPALCSAIQFAGTTLQWQGAYAEFIAVRENMLQRIPSGVSIDEGGMIEPLAVAHHTVELAHIAKGEAVLVIGAGPIGAAVTLFARLAGAGPVIVSEHSAERRALALELGATAVIDPGTEDVAQRFGTLAGRSPQIVFECVGVPGLLQEAIRLAGVRGRVVVAGVCLSEDRIMPLVGLSKEVSLQFTQCYTEDDFAKVIDLVARGEAQVTPLHTSTIGFAQLPTMFEALRTPSGQCKVLIDPSLG
ncbi:alcohol dehydrogenase catalytic domain-containing protein [Croceicoccus sp. F390]|uniref:Alcohol dehydrogenase catalytic domain-containing protein n=1 Tax=Croceicoccus esteveae TaxID=3075597 RepID=A0ABU2ZLC6_9SPHN|nr:alcohol dehydrogenase catalytic domain-containing protein [Croceicoccus sp. F390]MDT0577129.1 alcohol dehydrogenase catalytic domain-containing protein [Croceicoccus sp. F390]